MKRIVAPAILAFAACFLASCAAPNFDKRYAEALAAAETPYDSVEGPWEGTWLSGHNQHTGELKAIVTKRSGKKNRYQFVYWATWAKMKGTFKFEGDAERKCGAVHISGSKRLGLFKYNHDARMTPTKFEATYGTDAKDFGTFELSRPE